MILPGPLSGFRKRGAGISPGYAGVSREDQGKIKESRKVHLDTKTRLGYEYRYPREPRACTPKAAGRVWEPVD